MMDGSTLNSPPKIIIKKENIGLQEHQHQQYQYKLFNNNGSHDKFYEDLIKVKDRLEKAVPNMQQIIHIDMKRVKTNKVYERKLNYDLTGPRGLNWQCKQELQRLKSDERDVARDLIRLNRDLARISLPPSISRSPSIQQNRDLSRSQTPRFSSMGDINSSVASPQKSKVLPGCSSPINPSRITTNHLTPRRSSINKTNSLNENPPWVRNQPVSKTNENGPYLQLHAHEMNRQKQEIEQKLKEFLH